MKWESIKQSRIKAVYVSTAFILLGLLALVLTMNIAYAEKMLPRVKINGIDVGGMSKNSAQNRIDKVMSKRQDIKIQVEDETIKAEAIDLGISYDINGAVNEAYLYGKSGSVFKQVSQLTASIFTDHQYTVAAQINEDSINQFINEQISTKIKEPVNAELVYTGGQLEIVDDKEGLAIDISQLREDIARQAAVGESGVIEAVIKKVQADVTASDLVKYKDKISALAKKNVQINTDEKVLVPTYAQKITWFTLGEQSGRKAVVVNVDAVHETVDALAKQVNVDMVKEQIDPNGFVIAAGRDGKKLETNQIKTALVNKLESLLTNKSEAVALTAQVSVVPKEQTIVDPKTQGYSVVPAIDTEAKFIQINLSQQKMYLFENRQLVNVFAVSSGKSGMATPRGVHKIYNKALRPYSSEYGLYMPYWNAITAGGEYGIHELPEWPNGYKEGENHLGTPVSHGCVRLGVGSAKYVYDWAPIGTAVVVQ